MFDLGKLLLVVGAMLMAVGVVVLAGAKVGLGRLPGDLRWESDGVRVYVPVATCLLVSAVATILLNLFLRR